MKFFHAVKKSNLIGDGTAGDLVKWLEKYVNVLFPDNGVEYWSDCRNHITALQKADKVPAVGFGEDCIHHVACYVQGGCNEGHLIQVALVLRDGTYKTVTWAKVFGAVEEHWQICQAINDALNSILFYEELPEIVEMSDKVPRQYAWYRESSLKGKVTISATLTHLLVSTASGLILDQHDFTEFGGNAHFYVESRAKDWETVLTNTKVQFEVVNEKSMVVEGFLITDRGVPECEGFYVLPPGGVKLDDRTWLGYFRNLHKAVKAAQDTAPFFAQANDFVTGLAKAQQYCFEGGLYAA